MKTILVPVDFSDTSKNAAAYALNLASVVEAKKVILYHAFELTTIASPSMMTDTGAIPITALPVMSMEMMEEISNNNMRYFSESLQDICPAGVVVEKKTEPATLLDINEISKETGADLIVMGVEGLGKFEEALVGSMEISIVKISRVPVIIVPPDAKYTSVRNIMLASDLEKVAETIPVQPIKTLLNATKAQLYVVTIYENDKDISAEKTYQKELLHSLLKEYEPSFYLKSNDSFINGINDFVETNKINMIIAIPKKHGFFEGLFKERHTKMLAFHSHIPLMYIHEGDL